MSKQNIFDFADKFGFVSPFNNWMEGKETDSLFIKSKLKEPTNIEPSRGIELNEVEIKFVKYLFKIRNANSAFSVKPDNEKNQEWILPNSFFDLSAPAKNHKRERVFIAGKVFPIINIFYKNGKANATNIEKKTMFMHQRFELFGNEDYKMYSPFYISIDNDTIRILVANSYPKFVNYTDLLFNFLTNNIAVQSTIGGEFNDYETYKLAFNTKAQEMNDWKGHDGAWLTADRLEKNQRWSNGIRDIVLNKKMGCLAPFIQIYDFYNTIDQWLAFKKHEVKWCKGAKKLVLALSNGIEGLGGLEGGSMFIFNDVELILNELNLGICDYAITQFYDLLFGKYSNIPLNGDNAYNWDLEFITFEQGTVAVPIYDKASDETISRFQNMVDHDAKGSHGFGAWVADLLKSVTPAFDDFDPKAKVTDTLFRIDLPMLMLYLNKHNPNKNTKSFNKHINLKDGTVNESVKKLIRKYAI
jgi:hypothetical protein